MDIISFWQDNDWVIKILMVALIVLFFITLEKIYQFFIAYRRLSEFEKIENLDEIEKLKKSYLKERVKKITPFLNSSEALFNANVGVQLDKFEQDIMKYVTILSLIAVLSPMLGLIGTFGGVWHVFQGVGAVGLNDPAIIASGIKEVLIDTMMGLIVGIIAMVIYKAFEFMGQKIVTRFEESLYWHIKDSYAPKP